MATDADEDDEDDEDVLLWVVCACCTAQPPALPMTACPANDIPPTVVIKPV